MLQLQKERAFMELTGLKGCYMVTASKVSDEKATVSRTTRAVTCFLFILLAGDGVNHSALGGATDSLQYHGPSAATNRGNSEVYVSRGVELLRGAEWTAAASNFSRAVAASPNEADLYTWRASAYVGEGKLTEAIEDFTTAIQLRSDDCSYLNRGNTYRIKGELDKAIADLDTCVRLNPTNDYAYKLRAATYNAQGDFDHALSDANEGLRLNPNDANGLTERAFAYSHKGRYSEAISDLQEATLLDPGNGKPCNDLGWLLATCPETRLRDCSAALRWATRACELSQWKDWTHIDTLAAAFAANEEFAKAVEFQKRALAMKGVPLNDREEMEQRLARYVNCLRTKERSKGTSR